MARIHLGWRLTATILSLLVGLSAVCLTVLIIGVRQSQTLVADHLAQSTSASREAHNVVTAKVREQSLHQAEQALDDKLMSIATLIANSAVSPLITEDYGLLEAACQQAVSDSDAVWASVCKADGTLAAEARDPTQKAELNAAGITPELGFAARQSLLEKSLLEKSLLEKSLLEKSLLEKSLLEKSHELLQVTAPVLIDGKISGKVIIVATKTRLTAQYAAINASFPSLRRPPRPKPSTFASSSPRCRPAPADGWCGAC